jgi:WD40 repeat protein
MSQNLIKKYIDPNESFNSSPNLIFKETIIKDNYDDYFISDSFEVYYSYQNFNEIMIVSPNKQNEIRIMSLKRKKLIRVLRGHSALVCMVRHFFNPKNQCDYLISVDDDKILLVWDLSNNFKIKQTLNLTYKNIYSAIMIFDDSNDYIITSTYNNINLAEDFTKIFIFETGKFLRNIPNTNKAKTYYLLPWKNQVDNTWNVIDFCVGFILVNQINGEDKPLILKANVNFETGLTYYYGNIIGKDNNQLCAISEGGYLHIWNLFDSTLLQTMKFNNGILNTLLKWSDRYIIVSDRQNCLYYIIDIIANRIITKVKNNVKDFIKIFKKIKHPLLGDCMIICNHAHQIELWAMP